MSDAGASSTAFDRQQPLEVGSFIAEHNGNGGSNQECTDYSGAKQQTRPSELNAGDTPFTIIG